MWVIAGVLLGLVVIVSLLGFHVGPHAHVLAGVLGVAAAGWLIWMAVDGRSSAALSALLTADVVISGGVAVLAWKGLADQRRSLPPHHLHAVEGAEGVAVTALDPEGIVRVAGESWSAVAVNGSAPAGTPIQVIGAQGVRLQVWAETQLNALEGGRP